MAWWHKEIEDLELEIVSLKNEIQKANLVNMRLTKQLTLTDVSQQREQLPEFLMEDLDGKIITSVIGSADVTKEWNEWINKYLEAKKK